MLKHRSVPTAVSPRASFFRRPAFHMGLCLAVLGFFALLLLVAPTGGQSSAEGIRIWADSTGKHRIEAELVDCKDGVVRLKKSDDRIVSLPLSRLSAADQQHIQRQLADVATDSAGAQAEIEFVSGVKSKGRIVARDNENLTIEFETNGRRLQRKYPLARIHAISIDGRREVLNEKVARTSPPTGPRSPGRSAPAANSPRSSGNHRSAAQIEALVTQLGATQPDWWDDVPLDYPQTLDLDWPQPPPKGWNAQKNVGQYIWDITNPNPAKWKSGVKLMHELLQRHKNNPTVRLRAMNELGRMYAGLLQDYPRAIFWWRKAEVGKNGRFPGSAVRLVECYWKLGNKQMAMQALSQMPIYFSSIKLLADMGETQRAIQLAESGARSAPDLAYLIAGDACRIEGRYPQALQYYQKVLAVPPVGQPKGRIEKNITRARANIEAIRIFETLDLKRVADGTYRAEAPGYVGPLHVEVVIAAGRIESVKVVQHQEKQFYSALTDTPKQIIQMQGVKGVDAVTGATITSEAIINATAKGLAKGLR